MVGAQIIQIYVHNHAHIYKLFISAKEICTNTHTTIPVPFIIIFHLVTIFGAVFVPSFPQSQFPTLCVKTRGLLLYS